MSFGTLNYSLKALGSRLRVLNRKTYRVLVILLTTAKFDDAYGIISPKISCRLKPTFMVDRVLVAEWIQLP